LFFSCIEYPPAYHFIETRTVLYKTNIIGIAGPAVNQGEEYIEIRYSVADETRPGFNKTESIMVSPPYVFQNNRVNARYDFYEDRQLDEVLGYKEVLLHDYDEGGAEYLRIINHSEDKTVDFFIAGGQDMPDTVEGMEVTWNRSLLNTFFPPSVRYKKAPVQYLLFPDRKPNYNLKDWPEPVVYLFEGDSCGDITLTEPWTVDAVNELYRAEYKRSDKIRLSINYDDSKINEPGRLIDMVEKSAFSLHAYTGKIFWGELKPGESLAGSNKIWLLATQLMFYGENYLEPFQYENLLKWQNCPSTYSFSR
jgi:hypothetical protein